jgi:hypothetical protein
MTIQKTWRLLTAGTILGAAVFAFGAFLVPAGTEAADPTCSHLGIATHGEHIVGDYVTGTGGIGPGGISWPPEGEVGDAVGGNGAAVPGGPGPAFHFIEGFAAGASFCTDSASPGTHILP